MKKVKEQKRFFDAIEASGADSVLRNIAKTKIDKALEPVFQELVA